MISASIDGPAERPELYNAIDWERYIENRKSAVRCKAAHPCSIDFVYRELTEEGSGYDAELATRDGMFSIKDIM